MPIATVSLPPDVAARLDSIAMTAGLSRQGTARLLLTLLLRYHPAAAPAAGQASHVQ